MLQGYKTHIIGGLTVVFGVIGLVLGHLEPTQAVEFILGGLGLSALRAGVSNG